MVRHFIQFWLPKISGPGSYQKWLKYAIIVGVFFISILVALHPTSRMTLLVVGGLFAVFMAMILLRNLTLGLLGILVACFLIPNFLGSGGLGSTLSPPILLLLMVVGLWVVDMMVRQRQISHVRSRTNLPAFVFLVISLLAFFNGQILYYSFARLAPIAAQLGGLAVYLLSIVAFITAGNLIKDLHWLKIITWLFLALGAVFIIGRMIPLLGRVVLPRFQYGSTDSLFWIWLIAMASSQAFFNRQLDKRWRAVLFGLCAATFYVAISGAYSWKSGWLPPLVAVMVILWVGFPRLRMPLLILAGIAVVLNSFDKVTNLVSGGEDYSIMTRLVAWRIVLEIVKINPFLGLGMSNYYWYTPLFPILGYSVQFNSHNNYIDIFAQAGFFGLIGFSWLMFEIWRVGWEIRVKVPDGFARAYILGVLGGLIGTLVSGMLGDWFLPFVYNVGLQGFRSSVFAWLFFGGMIALEGIYRNIDSRGGEYASVDRHH